MPRGLLAVELAPPDVNVLPVVEGIPDIKFSDIRLLSVWATLASILALAALWRLVHHCFQFAVLARSPNLGRLKPSESRSPRVLAGHFTAVANAVVCVAAYLPAARQRLAVAGWSPGALIPLWSRPLAIEPLSLGSSVFYLSLAGYCLHACLLAAERGLGDDIWASERTVLLQSLLLGLLASSVCMVEFVPELTLAFLLLEVPSPFLALLQALRDFRLHLQPQFCAVSFIVVFLASKVRILGFGICLACAWSHTDASGKLDGHAPIVHFIFGLCTALVATYLVHTVQLLRDFKSDGEVGKDPR